jgi:hypothetical protein
MTIGIAHTDDEPSPREYPQRFRVVEVLDGLSILITGTLAVVTVYVAHAPSMGVAALYPFGPIWGFALIAWSLALLDKTHDRIANVAAIGLVLGSIAAMAAMTIIFVALVQEPGKLVGPLIGALVLLGIVFVREPHRRLGGFAVPVIVLITVGIMVTGIHGYLPNP